MPPASESKAASAKDAGKVKVKNALNQPLCEDGVVYPPANQKNGDDGKPIADSARVFLVTPERRKALGELVTDVE